VTECPTALPTKLAQTLAGHRGGLPVKVVAQAATRLGVPPLLRRRMTACGVQPVATVWPRFDHFSLFGAVEPTTGDRVFLEFPCLNSARFQRWVDDFAQPFAASFNVLVLDKGALHTAKTLRWPPNVAAVPFPSYRPALNPIERLWRDLKDQVADTVAKTLDAFSDAVCRLSQNYSHAALKSGQALRISCRQSRLPCTLRM
jgi:DDE superfamily endonuclease